MAITTNKQLKAFTESLLDGDTIEVDYFYNLLDVARVKVEAERNWKALEKEDTSQTASVGDTFLTTKTLPTDFASAIELFTARSDGSGELSYSPIAFKKRYFHRNSSRRFWIDYANGTFGLTGKTSESRTIHLIYKRTSTALSDSQTWSFPSRFWPILGFMVAAMIKAGSDYDQGNINQAVQQRTDAKELWDACQEWDSELRLAEMGHSYGINASTDSDGIPEAGAEDSFDLGQL